VYSESSLSSSKAIHLGVHDLPSPVFTVSSKSRATPSRHQNKKAPHRARNKVKFQIHTSTSAHFQVVATVSALVESHYLMNGQNDRRTMSGTQKMCLFRGRAVSPASTCPHISGPSTTGVVNDHYGLWRSAGPYERARRRRQQLVGCPCRRQDEVVIPIHG
jgi:hypothetical protein